MNWGILGLGRIAHRFASSLEKSHDVFYAGASQTEEKRASFSEKYHPIHMYSTYEELLDDPDVDVIYIALPHKFHYEWTMKCLKHNKHVLVEKPAFLTSQEALNVSSYALVHNLFFMEAMKTRFIPLIHRLHEIIDEKIIGEIESIDCNFTFPQPENQLAISYFYDSVMGGALYDTGIYCIAFINDFIDDEIIDMKINTHFCEHIDLNDKVLFQFKNHTTASFECGMMNENKRYGIIKGTKGSIYLDNFYRPTHAIISTIESKRSIEIPLIVDDFYGEIQAVDAAIMNAQIESTRMSHQDTIKSITILENLHHKLKEG